MTRPRTRQTVLLKQTVLVNAAEIELVDPPVLVSLASMQHPVVTMGA